MLALRWLKDDYSGTLRSGHLGTSCIRTVMIIEVSSFQGLKIYTVVKHGESLGYSGMHICIMHVSVLEGVYNLGIWNRGVPLHVY